MSVDAWAQYEPTAEAPWDLRRVVHLHRRAGFAATWDELQRDLKDGPAASIDRLLNAKARDTNVPANFDSTATLIADAAVASGDPARLKAWWVYRMLFSPDPLGERLALIWHNHFATSNLKVDDLGAMRRQNETFRTLARAPFGQLLEAALHDPALLTWLDAPANRKGHPNENLAREMLELFTLGIGHFQESDVQEAARALTGWTVADGQFLEIATRHDDGIKTILGRKGAWSGKDLIPMLREDRAIAERLAWRLCITFLGEGNADAEHISALADGLRKKNLDIGWAVATILRSQAFFDASNIGARVVGPVEFVVGAARALDMLQDPPSTLLLADWATRLGQDLFYPPNVGGWPGGRAWLTTRALIGRANFAAALVSGTGLGRAQPLDVFELAYRQGRGHGLDEVIACAAARIWGAEPDPAWHDRLAAEIGRASGWSPDAARRAVALALACPEAQLD
jgi:uncharacterized protein (DUF1800 family)